jgi:hypothetical protein
MGYRDIMPKDTAKARMLDLMPSIASLSPFCCSQFDARRSYFPRAKVNKSTTVTVSVLPSPFAALNKMLLHSPLCLAICCMAFFSWI